jgi:hypothetical protein
MASLCYNLLIIFNYILYKIIDFAKSDYIILLRFKSVHFFSVDNIELSDKSSDVVKKDHLIKF